MTGNENLSPSAQRLIESIGSPVTSEDVASYERIRQVDDTSFRLRTVINAWEKRQAQERTLRSRYAKWLLLALFLQIIVINITFFLIGFELLTVERWVASSFIIGVFAEVTGMTIVVVGYLFPVQTTGKSLEELNEEFTTED